MKKIDIEKIERKNIYSTPEHFHKKIQTNVLNQIKNSTENTEITYRRSNYWFAAASIVLIFISFYVLNDISMKNEDSKKELKFAENFSFEKTNEQEMVILMDDLSKKISAEQKQLDDKSSLGNEIHKIENTADFVGLKDLSNDEDFIYTLEQDAYLDLFN